jgi:hypothetical protein
MDRGDWINVRAVGGGIIRWRVVEQRDGRVYFCRGDEVGTAQQEGREPVVIGVRLWDTCLDGGQAASYYERILLGSTLISDRPLTPDERAYAKELADVPEIQGIIPGTSAT